MSTSQRASSIQSRAFSAGTFVDVDIDGSWCTGSVIRCKVDGSVVVAIHEEEFDDNGNYQYAVHLTISDISKVMPCINHDGELMKDPNLELTRNSPRSRPVVKAGAAHSEYDHSVSSFIDHADDMMQLLPLLNCIGLQ